MHIKNLHIENFRNIQKADVNFGKINVFTGKNSSGKSNFLLALSNCLRTETNFSDIFFDNVVTFGPGKSKALFKTTIEGINTRFIFSEKDGFVYFKPNSFVFENTFGKKSFSPTQHSLYYTGDYGKEKVAEGAELTTNKIDLIEKSKNLKHYNNDLVYEKSFVREKIESADGQEYIEKPEISNIENTEKFRSIFTDYSDKVYSWVDPKMFSSTSIYRFVVERIDNSEIYEQVLNRLKDTGTTKNNSYADIPFQQAKFIQLLADVQKSVKQKEQFSKDLKLYTENLVTDLSINLDGSVGNKGEIIVTSANAPRDIFYLSAGTAVMVYFILLKNWVQLGFDDRTYQKPDVMIFDEIDSIIHPALMNKFTEVLKSISKFVQLFISTHSPHFIDRFDKSELFWLKDTVSISERTKSSSIPSIYSYEEIIKRLPEDNTYFQDRKNSELFIDGLLDSIFPII